MMRRLFGAIGLVGLLVIAVPAANASASSSHAMTRIESPRANQVVSSHGHVGVVVRSRARLKAIRISVNGVDITRYFHGSRGVYRATLRRGHGLHPGVDELSVETRNYKDFDDVDFIVARRLSRLVRITGVHTPGDGAPAAAVVKTRHDTTLQAWVNGHRDDGAFEPQGAHYVGRFGANDWLRPGRNQLVALAYRTGASGRTAVYDVQSKAFWLKPGRLVASAGRNLVVNADDFTVLHASADDLGSRGRARGVTYRWRIVGHPHGSDGTLEHADSSAPGFTASAPGDYLIQATADGAKGAVSLDTVAVAVRADVPPMGWRLDTTDSYGTITLNGQPVPETTCSVALCPNVSFVSYAVFNRQTLQRETSGNLPYDPTTLKFLTDLAAKYNRAPTYLMVVNISRLFGIPAAVKPLLSALGAGNLSAPTDLPLPLSIVGIPGSPAGSAMVSALYRGCQCYPSMDVSNMSGYLRLNALSGDGNFEFVRTDQVMFNTNASSSPGQIAMQVGKQTYTHSVPTDGSSGFFLVTLNSQTLAPLSQNVYVTNSPTGVEDPTAGTQMYKVLLDATTGDNTGGRVLVMLQAFGRPRGVKFGWQLSGQTIEKLGGNAQVFAELNQATADEPHQGRYAMVGRMAMDVPAAESSASLTGDATGGTLQGMLARGRDDQYEPVIAGPAGSINSDLVDIVNRPIAPNGGFPQFTGGEAAAESFLGRDRDIMGVCSESAPTCDVRRSYYEKYSGVSWSTILTSLGQPAKDACAKAAAVDNAPFTYVQCDAVRQELQLEVSRRSRVEAYFGPNGLQAPFVGNLQVPALDIAAIANEIEKDVQPPAADNSASHVLNVISFMLKIAGAAGGLVNPGVGTAANGVAAAFGLAGYLTHQDGSPDLIGPQIKATAAQLGLDLNTRYQDASSYFTTEAQIVMSDWTKMSEVAALATSDPKWDLGDIRTTTSKIAAATRQVIYQALIPVAYPVLYDLGTGITDAKTWICRSVPTFLYDKNLFQNTGPGAQVPWLVPDPQLPGQVPAQVHLIAIGAQHTVGSLHSAYVPAPPEELTKKLFRDPNDPQPGGIGLYKLQFYSSQNFRVFPKILQQTRPGGQALGYWTCQDMPDPPGNAGK